MLVNERSLCVLEVQQMKEKILFKSLDLFSQKGFDAVSVSMISEGLGISKGALYKHYESKKAIFDAIVKRMEEQDHSMSQSFSVPEESFENMPEAYRSSKMKDLLAFTFAMFIYWTEDGFASKFRRMLSIEQFNSPEMGELYQQYLGTGPLGYVEDMFSQMEELRSLGSNSRNLALEFYSPVFMLMSIYDSTADKRCCADMLKAHFEAFIDRLKFSGKISYPRSEKYCIPELMSLIMGPNPIKLTEELMENNQIKPGSFVCDLGCGKGLSSVFLANEYGFRVFAADLWSEPEENARFFAGLGFGEEQICAVKADAMSMPFEKEFFDAVVSVDSYNYFGREPGFLEEKLLPFVKSGGYIYIAIPGMKKDCHEALPEELLLSWNAEQLDFMHDADYWRAIIEPTPGLEIISLREMRSNKEVWDDWLKQDNEYAVGDRRSMEAGAGKYLNFIQIILKKN